MDKASDFDLHNERKNDPSDRLLSFFRYEHLPENLQMKCRFCPSMAVAIVSLSNGCACYPHDREQALCLQHFVKASPLGSFEVTLVLVPELYQVIVDRGDATWPTVASKPDPRDAIR